MTLKIPYTLTLCILLLSLILACKKESRSPYISPTFNYDTLPPITHTGANTFGCYVNGELWVAQVPLGTVTYHDIIAQLKESDSEGYFFIECNNIDPQNQISDWISFSLNTELTENTFCNSDQVFAQYKDTNGNWCKNGYFDCDSCCVTITNLDTVENIVSGLFEFVVNPDSLNLNNKVRITDGRFDVRYFPF
ncbi:MAG: hypothetical protein R2792_08470 [Saprospiraceae bacterium]